MVKFVPNLHAYTEDQLVEQPAIGLFASLDWQTTSAMEETLGTSGTLGRETKGELVLVERLRVARTKLNPDLTPEANQTAIDELARDRSAMSLEAANREIYKRFDKSYCKKIVLDCRKCVGKKVSNALAQEPDQKQRGDCLAKEKTTQFRP
jgi:hypothetical protein